MLSKKATIFIEKLQKHKYFKAIFDKPNATSFFAWEKGPEQGRF